MQHVCLHIPASSRASYGKKAEKRQKGVAMEFGCSSFAWNTEDGTHLLGRTYDQFGTLSGNRIVLIPPGTAMGTAVGTREKNVRVRYAMAGMAVMGLHTPILVDGVNEKGLMGALLNYPGYGVSEMIKQDGKSSVHPGFLVNFLLGRAESVEEAVRELKKIRISNELVFGETMSVHYMFSDRTGEAVVVEPEEGGLKIHRDTIGVMTNSPDYLWHRTNLRNYGGVFYSEGPRKFLNMELMGFGEALGGGFGLPGDYSSPSRFVRLAALKEAAVKGKNEEDGVMRMFQIFSSVDTPEGILRSEDKEKGYEMTLCISVMCAESGTYYFSVRENRRICAVQLNGKLEGQGICCYELPRRQDVDYWN